MSVYEKWSSGVEARNAEAMIACLHEDFVFVRHQSGTEMNKAQMSEMLRGFMASDQVEVRSQRCLYENTEVMVEHSVMDFADGSTEAIIGFNQLKDGLIFRTETGATPVSS